MNARSRIHPASRQAAAEVLAKIAAELGNEPTPADQIRFCNLPLEDDTETPPLRAEYIVDGVVRSSVSLAPRNAPGTR